MSDQRETDDPTGGETAGRDGWTQLEARAFNAVGPAVRDAGQWLPLSARRAVAKAVLAELKPELDRLADYENRITWDTTCGSCARILDSSIRETERADRAVTALARARSLHQENCPLATGKVGRAAFTCGMCDALADPKETP
jgi:hypothetical protein